MRSAASLLVVAAATAALGGCHKAAQPDPAQNQDMSVEGNLAAGQIPENAEIETLPPDESSGTSSGELAKGDDNPDVNELGNSQ